MSRNARVINQIFRRQLGDNTINITNFTQSLGAELLSNWDFSAFTADLPDGWTNSEASGSDLTERDPDQTHGDTKTTGGALNMYSAAANNVPQVSQAVLTAGQWIEVEAVLSAYTSGTNVQIRDTSLYFRLQNMDSVGTKHGISQVNSDTLRVLTSTAPIDLTWDSISAKVITLNPNQEGFVNGNGSYVFRFTLPGSSEQGHGVYLPYRIAGSQSRWEAWLNYSGSAWNITLDSIVTATKTNRITANGVGTPTMIGVYIDGNDHKLYTGTGASIAGATWTQRGSTVTNTTHNTSREFNAVYSSDVTPLQLYASPNNIFV